MNFRNQVEGLFLNCAMNSRGIQLSGGIGNEMARLLGKQIRKSKTRPSAHGMSDPGVDPLEILDF